MRCRDDRRRRRGDAGQTFPDVREGAEAAVKLINDQLGGIGADFEKGTPGRPIVNHVASPARLVIPPRH